MPEKPTGQGLRIKVSIESTHPPIEFTVPTSFVAYNKSSDIQRRVHAAIKEATDIAIETFDNQFIDRIKSVY